jgi:hypothetical protein
VLRRPVEPAPQRGIDCGALFRDKQLPVDGAAVGVIQVLKLNPEIMIAAASRVVRSGMEPTGRAFARRVGSIRTTALIFCPSGKSVRVLPACLSSPFCKNISVLA